MTTFSTTSRARLRHAKRRAGGPNRREETRSHRGTGCVTETTTTARTKRGRPGYCPTPGAAACRALSGGSPDGRAARRQVSCPASAGRRYPPLRCPDGRACRIRPWPVLRAWHPLAGQRSPSSALATLASYGWRYAPHWTVIFPGKTVGTYRKDGANRGGLFPPDCRIAPRRSAFTTSVVAIPRAAPALRAAATTRAKRPRRTIWRTPLTDALTLGCRIEPYLINGSSAVFSLRRPWCP